MILGSFTFYSLNSFYSFLCFFYYLVLILIMMRMMMSIFMMIRMVIGDLSGAKIRQSDFLSSTSRVDFRLN